jgi:hypothetical protein
MRGLGKARPDGLLGSEKTLLGLRDLDFVVMSPDTATTWEGWPIY